MIYLANTILRGNWLEEVKNLPFVEHTDKDLLKNQAIALKSETGKYDDLYRTEDIEKPENFHFTELYYKNKIIKNLVDYFELETTRIRIHRQLPGVKVPLHSDYNNPTRVTTIHDYRIRIFVPLNDNKDFLYHFHDSRKHLVKSFKKGQIITFDPDLLYHGTENNSDETRYLLVIVAKPNKWLFNLNNSPEKREINV